MTFTTNRLINHSFSFINPKNNFTIEFSSENHWMQSTTMHGMRRQLLLVVRWLHIPAKPVRPLLQPRRMRWSSFWRGRPQTLREGCPYNVTHRNYLKLIARDRFDPMTPPLAIFQIHFLLTFIHVGVVFYLCLHFDVIVWIFWGVLPLFIMIWRARKRIIWFNFWKFDFHTSS